MKRTNELQGQRLPDLDYRENFSMRQDPPGTFRKIINAPPAARDLVAVATDSLGRAA